MEKFLAVKKRRDSKHIPDDIVFSILSKLPLKYLKQFACVCKSWFHLFENPNFMRIYRNNFISNSHSCNDNTSLLVLQNTEDSVLYSVSGERFEKMVKLEWPPPFKGNDSYICILDSGSINGIVCLYQGFKKVVLWNPATAEFKVIPRSPVEQLPYDGTVVLLHGFGYDRVRDDYKVIRRVEIVAPVGDELEIEDDSMVYYEYLWEIYSLRSNSWRILDVYMPCCYADSTSVQVYLDGMCHWWGESDKNNDEAYLLSFDLSTEVFFTTHAPSDMDDSFDFRFVRRHLMVLNGSIALVSNYVHTTTFHISILGEVGVMESWTKLFIVGPLPCVEHPIGVGKKNIFFIKKDEELAWLDLSTQKIEELGVKGGRFRSQIVNYKKSLLPIVGINE